MEQQSYANIDIDSEIRSLVYLLNETPYIQTHSCCSGHPTDPSQQWKSGWIAMVPIGDFCSFWKFLNELHVKLNHSSERPLELFRQVDAQALFSSTAPLLDVYCRLKFGAGRKRDIHIWNYLVNATQEFLAEEEFISVKTAAEGADVLTDKLHLTSHVQSEKTKFGVHIIDYRAVWSYNSCKWCWDLVEHVNRLLFNIVGEYDWFHELYSGRNEKLRLRRRRFEKVDLDLNPSFCTRVIFNIRPIIRIKSRDIKRTREEHVQIWRLTELVAASLIRDVMILPDSNVQKGE